MHRRQLAIVHVPDESVVVVNAWSSPPPTTPSRPEPRHGDVDGRDARPSLVSAGLPSASNHTRSPMVPVPSKPKSTSLRRSARARLATHRSAWRCHRRGLHRKLQGQDRPHRPPRCSCRSVGGRPASCRSSSCRQQDLVVALLPAAPLGTEVGDGHVDAERRLADVVHAGRRRDPTTRSPTTRGRA